MLWQFFSWYLVVQLITAAALPLTLRLFVNLADRGYAFAKSLGILLVGVILWLGTSYGLLRNEAGGAWLALARLAALSLTIRGGWRRGRYFGGNRSAAQGATGVEGAGASGPALARSARFPVSVRYLVFIELLFLLAFAVWAYVRAYDPAANHTEKPMDLMFMNSIWSSPTFPPRDAWLSGYAISYYYLGYWLLTTVGRLAGQPPAISYTVGQACWFGLLLIGCAGVGYNLLRRAGRGERTAVAGGLLSAVAVGVTGNLQVIFEWLYANGVNVTPLAKWFAVNGFPEQAAQTGNWFIGLDWWWWRSSRVLEDLSLRGDHQEVIDEFPIFSYVLGDNHPHVLAMPFVLLVIALAQNLFFACSPAPTPGQPPAADGEHAGLADRLHSLWTSLRSALPGGSAGALLLTVAVGSLVFFNTWDYPPYWLLVTLALFAVLLRRPLAAISTGRALLIAGLAGAGLLLGTLVIYLPYFLSAQSQAGGFIPNFFNPTRIGQFLVMFGAGLCGLVALIGLAWPLARPPARLLATSLLVVYGAPLLFLAVALAAAFGTARGQALLSYMELPAGSTSYWPFVVERWSRQGWTFLLVGALLALVLALLWQLTVAARRSAVASTDLQQATTFVLLLAGLGLALVLAPEIIYLRDNFGWRMNTIFKFYYQAWLLFGLSTSYAIVLALSHRRSTAGWTVALSLVALLLIGGGLIYPVAAAYSKTGGFALATPSFDAVAYVGQENPAELAAINWVRANVPPDAVVVQGIGIPYRANTARISTATGRATLLGWDGHERQWRGKAYDEMAGGRSEALDQIYRSGSADQIKQALARWDIDYVYVGPSERSQYGMTPLSEERLAQVMSLVFAEGDVHIYQRRGD